MFRENQTILEREVNSIRKSKEQMHHFIWGRVNR